MTSLRHACHVATATIGFAGGLPASDPKEGLSEKLKMPPPLPTMRYPVAVAVAVAVGERADGAVQRVVLPQIGWAALAEPSAWVGTPNDEGLPEIRAHGRAAA